MFFEGEQVQKLTTMIENECENMIKQVIRKPLEKDQNMNLETFAVNFSEKLHQKASKIESLLFYSAFEEPKRELLVFYNVICVPS